MINKERAMGKHISSRSDEKLVRDVKDAVEILQKKSKAQDTTNNKSMIVTMIALGTGIRIVFVITTVVLRVIRIKIMIMVATGIGTGTVREDVSKIMTEIGIVIESEITAEIETMTEISIMREPSQDGTSWNRAIVGVETEFEDDMPQLLSFNLSVAGFEFVLAPLKAWEVAETPKKNLLMMGFMM